MNVDVDIRIDESAYVSIFFDTRLHAYDWRVSYRRVWFAEHKPRSTNQIIRTVSPFHFQISVFEIRTDIFFYFSSF